jgi:uroporphyrinogen-III synthase
MRVLVTRPRPDADETAAELIALGHEPVIAPLLEVTFDIGTPLELSDAQAILITSANGVRALASATDRRDLPIFAVGDASAAAARQYGFERTESADGNVQTLAELVVARLSPRDGQLVHVAGTVTAGDLSGKLALSGFGVRRAVLYRAEPVPDLPDVIGERLRSSTLEAAIFFSPRTAAHFCELITSGGLVEHCGRIVAIALSNAVAEKLEKLAFSDILTAETPDQDSLFRALDATKA